MTGITLADGREWKEIHCICISRAKFWLLCVLASLPTSGPALHDVQIEQWSINPRVLTTYTAFLHTVCILELGIVLSLSSALQHLVLNLPPDYRSPSPLIHHDPAWVVSVAHGGNSMGPLKWSRIYIPWDRSENIKIGKSVSFN